jgi:hypothetical protein
MAFLLKQRTTMQRATPASRDLVLKPDSLSCQRQRLSFIRRGFCAIRTLRKSIDLSKPWMGGRAEQAKLTACRKVGRMYRRMQGKSSYKARKIRRFRAF